MSKTFNAYSKKAHETLSTGDFLDRVLTEELLSNLRVFVGLARTIDNYKKAAFYGRNIDSYPQPTQVTDRKDIDLNTFHGLLGVAGEAGEVIEVLLDRLDGKISDTEFQELLKGEGGDLLWYLTVGLEGSDIKLEDAATANNDKLASRWEKAKAEGKTDFK